MISFFQKSVRDIGPDDVRELVDERFPEGFELEFKETLPEKDGRPPPWTSGKDEISSVARDKIVAEVIAFANAQGGYVLLGISETKEKPPRAAELSPLPRIGELAKRLEDQARACIEPAIPRLEFHPVETSPSEGVLVIYCAASNRAPHRLTTNNEAFVRRGSSAVRMTMREIQEMSIMVANTLSGVPTAFGSRALEFQRWLQRKHCAAFRVSCLPVRKLPDPGRLLGKQELSAPSASQFKAIVDSRSTELSVPLFYGTTRPITRGIRHTAETRGGDSRIEIKQDGSVDFWFLSDADDPRSSDPMCLYHGWLLGGVVVTLHLVDKLRTLSNVPNVEFAMQIEISAYPTNRSIQYRGLFNSYGTDTVELPGTPTILDDFSVGNRSEFDELLSLVDIDIYDASGSRRNPRTFAVEWP